jgi:hypothetical protein
VCHGGYCEARGKSHQSLSHLDLSEQRGWKLAQAPRPHRPIGNADIFADRRRFPRFDTVLSLSFRLDHLTESPKLLSRETLDLSWNGLCFVMKLWLELGTKQGVL